MKPQLVTVVKICCCVSFADDKLVVELHTEFSSSNDVVSKIAASIARYPGPCTDGLYGATRNATSGENELFFC